LHSATKFRNLERLGGFIFVQIRAVAGVVRVTCKAHDCTDSLEL